MTDTRRIGWQHNPAQLMLPMYWDGSRWTENGPKDEAFALLAYRWSAQKCKCPKFNWQDRGNTETLSTVNFGDVCRTCKKQRADSDQTNQILATGVGTTNAAVAAIHEQALRNTKVKNRDASKTMLWWIVGFLLMAFIGALASGGEPTSNTGNGYQAEDSYEIAGSNDGFSGTP